MTTAWTKDDVHRIGHSEPAIVPLVNAVRPRLLNADRLYWDMWPVQDHHGRPAMLAGRQLWMALTAPDRGDPAARHFEARIHLLERIGADWRDLGPVIPAQRVPYEREWAGSAVTDGASISLYFTGAGIAERAGGYQQRLFETHGIIGDDGLPTGWSAPRASIAQAHAAYMPADAHAGEAGRIKAFRDPAWFRDPADGQQYLIFTASLAGASTEYNGAVGIAQRVDEGWVLLPPLVHADGVNNELERAHIVHHQGRYFLFWATQTATFAPDLRHAPTGLYGMVADSLSGPYRPLGGSGLVLKNPDSAPAQTYSWSLTSDLEVSSFVDIWPPTPHGDGRMEAGAQSRFGGVPAPMLRLIIDGDRCMLAEPALG
jgi:levansucrase